MQRSDATNTRSIHQITVPARNTLIASAALFCAGSLFAVTARAQSGSKKDVRADEEYQKVLTTVRQLSKTVAGTDTAAVIPSASFHKDLGFDSLDAVEVILGLEKEYHIRIPDADVEKMVTVHDAVVVVRRQLHRR